MATEPNLESAPQRLSVVTEQLAELSSFLDPAGLADQVSELEARMGAEGFWDNQEQAARVSAEHARVSRRLERWQELSADGDDLATMLELADEDPSLAGEFEGQLLDVERRLAAFEEERLFAGDYDAGDALVTVNAGAGGTDAQDWAEMVLRMMIRWAEGRGFEVELLEASAGRRLGLSQRPSKQLAKTPTACSAPSAASTASSASHHLIPPAAGRHHLRGLKSHRSLMRLKA